MSNYYEIYNKVKKQYLEDGGQIAEEDNASERTKKLLKEVEGLAYVPKKITGADAPDKIELNKLEEDTRTSEDIKKEVEAILASKYEKNKLEDEKMSNEKKAIVENKKTQNATIKLEKDKGINKIYDNYADNAENQALKRGLARSSIIIEQLDGIEAERAEQLTKNATDYAETLKVLESEIASINTELQEDLSLLELDLASEKQTLLDKKITELEQTKREIVEFNNNVEKLQAEYALKKEDQDITNAKRTEELLNSEEEKKAQETAFENQYNLIFNTLKSLGKENALKELFSNSKYAEVLGGYINDMYYALRYSKY